MPANTGVAGPDFVTARSARLVTVVLAVPVLLVALGSFEVVTAIALLVRTVPSAVAGSTRTVMVKVAVLPGDSVPMLAVTVPLLCVGAPCAAGRDEARVRWHRMVPPRRLQGLARCSWTVRCR